jgi:hypothetical protein
MQKKRKIGAFQIPENECCGFGMFIPDPDFLPIPDPGYKNLNKREG